MESLTSQHSEASVFYRDDIDHSTRAEGLSSPQSIESGALTSSLGPENEFADCLPRIEKLRQEKEAYRRRKQRQRRKDERESLRKEEHELLLHLQTLKQAIETNPGTNRASVQLSNYYWRDCAARQKQQRLAVEMEQKRLVAATNAQATYIDNLMKLVQRRPSNEVENQIQGIHESNALETHDDAVFAALLKEVDDRYCHVSKLLRECRMDDLPLGIINTEHRRETDGKLEYLKHVNKAMQPFDYEDTYHSYWKVAGHPHRQHDREVYAGTAGLENIIAIKFRVMRTLMTGATVSMKQWYVVRRYVEKDRVIHGWKIYSEGEGILRGMHADETGWSRFRRTSDGFGTWTEAIVHQVPLFFSSVCLNDAIVEEFRQLLQDKLDEDKDLITEAMEGLLLEDTLAILDE